MDDGRVENPQSFVPEIFIWGGQDARFEVAYRWFPAYGGRSWKTTYAEMEVNAGGALPILGDVNMQQRHPCLHEGKQQHDCL